MLVNSLEQLRAGRGGGWPGGGCNVYHLQSARSAVRAPRQRGGIRRRRYRSR